MNIDYTNNYKHNYNVFSNKDIGNIKNLSKNIDNYTFWNFSEFVSFIIKNYKQIFLLFSVFIIIFVIEKITQYNSAVFSMPSVIPGLNIKNSDKKKKK